VDAPADPTAPVEGTLDAAATPSLSDDTLLDFVIDGQPVKMTLAEARRNISLHSASTKRFQDASELRKQAEAIAEREKQHAQRAEQAEAKVAQIMAILKDKQKLATLYMAATGQDQAPPTAAQPTAQPAAKPFDPATIETTARGVFAQEIARMQQEQQGAALHADLTGHMTELVKDHATLSAIFAMSPSVADDIYGRVLSMEPTSVPQAKEFIAAEIAEMKAKLGSTTTAAAKHAVLTKAADVSATERGGSPLVPAPKKYKGLDDPQRFADIEAFAQAQG
jgi:hypothetical protein